MEIGLLWYDGDAKRPLEQKVGQAATRYHEKFERWPDTCYVHPGAVGDSPDGVSVPNPQAAPIRVLASPTVLLHHLWIGVRERDDHVQ